MVDSVVTFALENLSRLLVSEVTLLASVEDQIKSLRDELSFMDIFIKSSKGKREDPLVREVVNQIIDVAYQAEDVVDTYVVNVNKQRSRNIFGKCFHSKHHVMMLHEVNDQINTIKKRINEIYQNKSKYDIQQGDFESTIENKEFAKDSSLLARRRDVEEDEVVGLVHDSDEVISHLDERGDSSRRAVCIIGMGGLGKTTLARKIYNSNKVKCMFPYRVWGFVSNYYRAQELLMSLLKLLGLSTEECKDLTDQEKMKEKVKECMSGKKYLIVLDDIWKTQVWDELQKAFPDDNNGSRILITTRVEDISHYTRASFTYRLPFLEESQSWELFCNKVFCKEKCPHELESLGMEMTKACKGLPLAIVVLAGMVAKKEKSQREWHKIKDHVSWYLAQEDYRIVTDILKLSYDDLPQILKPCFLYLGVYPEDYEISVRILCRLWIAEGFIQAKEVGTSNSPEAEDIADMYLDRLVERSLVQVASKRSDGGVKTCRVHDLLRDLCILESRENKFMEVCTELDINKHNSRRVSLQNRGKFWPIKDNQSHAHARSLLRFGERAYWNDKSQGWKRIRNSFKLARVLDMNDVLLYLSPSSELKTLIHLRYLKMTIRDSEIMNNTLDFICNFWNLETLHLMFEEYCSITLPSKIWKLKSLRHIHLKYYVKKWTWGASMSKMKIGEAKVENLQTLGDISLDVRTTSFLNKGMFPNLTKLTLCRMEGRQEEEEELLGKVLQCLNKLRTLKLIGISEILLDPNVFPSSLTKITIKHFSKLDPRIIKTLGQLPYLQILKLCEGKIHGYVNCGAGDFLKLQVLHVTDVSMVDADSWKIEEGTMPHIRHRLIRIIPDETC